ncbi:hypothetical protein V474_20215 [Novosphingobium barchaimii LL02]|uniref:Uncharacterized protein n=1 Tax=Novosphingobium barchaimii LL02 TaxID=1114963 RepID=A0A0J7XUQ4_9SPHN|nr:phage tail protein [Novosphingobium barchaimii]KMS55362.1 hypothetical protein V474_20215 [Novosphingobium barchaimii LL02]
MATLVFSSLGTMLGGPVGGAIGSLVGRQFDSALFGPSARQGPRLKELAVTTSSYGQILPRHFGRMRVAGSIIWATELVEHSELQGTGKGAPALTTYSYTANFAVALASRPILGIGRIWADGKLLRGAEGDLKAGGTMRVHTGAGDQPVDPLIAAAEGERYCPAHRDLAYVVFEDLDLSEFYNRIPSLTFEVIADERFDLQTVIGEVIEGIDASVPLDGMAGYSSEGSPATDLEVFEQVMPLEIDAGGDTLFIARERRQEAAITLAEPAAATGDDDFGGGAGFTRRRAPQSDRPAAILRYYDVGRDYQASVQRPSGQPAPGEPATLDLPAALDAATARMLIERTARRVDWSRDRISWRTSELDPGVAPGALVALPGIAGLWRVREWEWRESGVELALERALPTGADAAPLLGSDPGRGNPPLDVPLAETRLMAFELPLDGPSGAPDRARAFAAASGTSANWNGAALYADRGDGQLLPLGASGRTRATIGTARSVLPAANPLLFDRGSNLLVSLVDPDMRLAGADTRQLADGADLALVGEEIVQFAKATALGNGLWRIDGLLRGRGGTEAAVDTHGENESFALLDARLTALDSGTLGSDPSRQVVALARQDTEPFAAPVLLGGITLRPLAPVHPRTVMSQDGARTVSWTRRARGGWPWQDEVDVPLVEQAERYLITLGAFDAPLAAWATDTPSLTIDAVTLTRLAMLAPGSALHVRQQGTHALSHPLLLCTLP